MDTSNLQILDLAKTTSLDNTILTPYVVHQSTSHLRSLTNLATAKQLIGGASVPSSMNYSQDYRPSTPKITQNYSKKLKPVNPK